jgi:hypothetical protein
MLRDAKRLVRGWMQGVIEGMESADIRVAYRYLFVRLGSLLLPGLSGPGVSVRNGRLVIDLGGCKFIEEIRWRPVAASPPDPDPSVEFSVDGVNWHATEEAWAPGLRAPNLPGSPLCARFISIPGDRQQWLRAGHCFLRQALPPLKFGVLRDLSIRQAGLSCEYLSTHSHGLFSNLSTTLADVIRLNQAEVTVRRIGFERGMMQFKDDAAKDVYPVFFGASAPGDVGGPVTAFDAQTDNHKNYRDLPLAALGAHVKRYFWPSRRVLDVARTLMERAHVNPGNTLAVCFRGTDKSKEVQLASVEDYIRVVEALDAQSSAPRDLLIQTDQQQALEAFVSRFGARVRSFESIPRTRGAVAVHDLDFEKVLKLSREQFSIELIAAIHVIAQCATVVTTTSNVGLWIALYRGSAGNLYQFDAAGRLVPPFEGRAA